MMTRRNVLTNSLSLAGLALLPAGKGGLVNLALAKSDSALVNIALFDDTGKQLRIEQVAKVDKTEQQWRAQLTPLQFQVTRQQGTERAFTGEYDHVYAAGLYRCICCNNALFSSATKYDSKTGWPSFWAPIAKTNVRTSEDTSLGLTRSDGPGAACDALSRRGVQRS